MCNQTLLEKGLLLPENSTSHPEKKHNLLENSTNHLEKKPNLLQNSYNLLEKVWHLLEKKQRRHKSHQIRQGSP